MELTEDEIIQKYAKQCPSCDNYALLPYEYEFTCLFCGQNIIKTKNQLSKNSRKKQSFCLRLKCAEEKIIAIVR